MTRRLPPMAARLAPLAARWDTARESFQAQWTRATPRERRLLRLLAWVAAAALLYLIALRPAWRDVARWQDELPVLRAQAAAVDALAQEARALRRGQRPGAAPAAVEEALRKSLARAALGDAPRVTALDDGPGWEIAFERVPASALFEWLAQAPGPLRLRVEQARIVRPRDALGKPLPARASGTVQLRPAPAPESGGRP